MTQIAFTGDIAFTKYFSNSCDDKNLLDEEIVQFFSSSDYTVVNMEGAVSNSPTEVDKPLTHEILWSALSGLKKLMETYGILQTTT